jgi:hypothetical protein
MQAPLSELSGRERKQGGVTAEKRTPDIRKNTKEWHFKKGAALYYSYSQDIFLEGL